MINYNRLGYEIKRDVTNFSTKISQGLKLPQQKFIHQMVYGILAGNKLHLSEIARSLKEGITLKKTIDRLSRNLNSFGEKQPVMQNYLSLVRQHVKEDYAVIVIDNSDIAKPASRKLEALSKIRDGSIGEITQGYLTIEAAVLSETGKMPLPVYEKVFSAAENGFISETHENLCCLGFLSENFTPRCVRTLDRGFDANDYYRYFLKHGERFVIRAKKNRNVIYNGKTCNIMDVAAKYKGNYCMGFKDKSGKTLNCKMSCIPVRLCEFPAKELMLVAVYGFGAEPMLLLSNLKMQEKKRLCHIVAKVYLMRWRIEEYFKFKKQQFELEDLRVMSLQSIRNLNLFATLAAGYIGLTSTVHSESIFLKELKECSKRIYEVPKFIFYALGYALERVLSMSRKGINGFLPKKVKSQQLNLFEHFKIADTGAFDSKNGETQKFYIIDTLIRCDIIILLITRNYVYFNKEDNAMSLYYNPGIVDVEEAERGILAAGGDKTVQQKASYEHIVVYSRSENRHLSYDKYPDGHIENVHTDKDNHGYTTYGGAQ